MRSRSRRPWKEELKDLFAMHGAERNGFVVLMTACLILAGYITYQRTWGASNSFEHAAVEVAWRELNGSAPASAEHAQGSGDQVEKGRLVLFKFDPRDLPVDQWVALGLSERQAAAIHRFEAKGGRFRCKQDLARMRVVDPELFAQWEPYILLPDSLPRERSGVDGVREKGPAFDPEPMRISALTSSRTLIDVNAADSAALVAIPGIGPSFAKGIIKFRERVGGFHSLDQLGEVYVLRDKPEAVDRLKTCFSLDPDKVHRWPINTVSAEELGPHPYAGWKVAKAIVAYRKQHGPFKRLDDVKGCVLVTDSVYRKLAPYLTLE